MKVTNLRDIRVLKQGDSVMATFETSGEKGIEEATGELVLIDDDCIVIDINHTGRSNKHKYSIYRLLSLICMEKDLSYVREKPMGADLDAIVSMFEKRHSWR